MFETAQDGANENYIGKVPTPLSDFLKHYYETIIKWIVIQQTLTAVRCRVHKTGTSFKLYQRIVQDFEGFFDYCFVKGLDSNEFLEIQKDDVHFIDGQDFSFDSVPLKA